MSRKAKQPKAQAKSLAPHVRESAALAADAAAALGASRYKDATELYKELVKRESRPDWVEGLAASYAGRAHELADKGMIKEALVLWRNRTQLCGKPLAEGPYLGWLLQAGEQGEMSRLLADASLPDAARAELEMHLAAAMLAAPANALPGLPADSALLRHLPAAQAALAAYCRGDFAALEAQLSAIPFRSPYRDLKPLLKALALLQSDVEAARTAIARLSVGGGFERLAAALRAAVLPDGGWLAALSDLDEGSQQLVLDIKGCPNAVRPLLLELAKLGDAPVAALLFDVLTRHRRSIPANAFAELCLRLLPHLGKRLKSNADFRKLPQEQRLHVLALADELQGTLESANAHWGEMMELLSAHPDQKLRIALILRHLAALGRRNRMEEGVDGGAFEYLKRSLEFDPEDRDATLTVIGVLRSDNDLVQARAYLDKALLRFPKDAKVLLEAVEVALAGKAFKKAVGLAKQVLELDPINPQVRGLIGQALFSHARKQIKAHNPVAARKELDAAEEWLKSPTERAMLKLLRALVAEEQRDAGHPLLLREAMADFGVPLVGAFHLLLEAGKVGSNPKALLLKAEGNLASTPSTDAVVALAHALNAVPEGEKALGAALEPLRAMLKRAAKLKFAEADHLLVCEALQRIEEDELLAVYAKAALKRWPGRPVFIYLDVVARYGSCYYDIPDRVLYMLDDIVDDARAQGDHRTAARIRALLSPPPDDDFMDDDDDELFGMPFPDMKGGFDPFGGLPADPRTMLELVVAMEGEKALFEMVRQTLGKKVLDDLKKQSGGNKPDFIGRLIDMLVKGAPPNYLPDADAASPVKRPQPRKLPAPAPENQKELFDE
ncbi:MAG: hypothetical protein WC091_12955 [Sulfuricellaceae bacterium]